MADQHKIINLRWERFKHRIKLPTKRVKGYINRFFNKKSKVHKKNTNKNRHVKE